MKTIFPILAAGLLLLAGCGKFHVLESPAPKTDEAVAAVIAQFTTAQDKTKNAVQVSAEKARERADSHALWLKIGGGVLAALTLYANRKDKPK